MLPLEVKKNCPKIRIIMSKCYKKIFKTQELFAKTHADRKYIITAGMQNNMHGYPAEFAG